MLKASDGWGFDLQYVLCNVAGIVVDFSLIVAKTRE